MKNNLKLLTGSLTLQNLDTQWTMRLLALALVCKPKENILLFLLKYGM